MPLPPLSPPYGSSPRLQVEAPVLNVYPELVFSCNFESGNLDRVERVSSFEYDLYIRPDTFARRQRVWFHFAVKNTQFRQVVILNVMNFSKSKSLYRMGMSPVVRSRKRPRWQRLPSRDCFYWRSENPQIGRFSEDAPSSQQESTSLLIPPLDETSFRSIRGYRLSFLFAFDDPDDEYYFAYCYPYTYSDLQRYLYLVERRDLSFCRRFLLQRTLLHRRIDSLIITEPTETIRKGDSTGIQSKRAIFVSARVHPGESPSSYVVEGFIEFLLSSHPLAEFLRQKFIFLVVPMLNPDGVYVGNYRSDFLGFDLNRCWLWPLREYHPSLFTSRELMRMLCGRVNSVTTDYLSDSLLDSVSQIGPELARLLQDQKSSLDMFIDIHSHSNATSGFMYVNYNHDESAQEKGMQLPRIFDVRCRHFSLLDSRLCKDPQKLSSGRRALGEFILHGPLCYTFEVSFYCSIDARRKSIPLSQNSYRQLGWDLGRSIGEFYDHH